MKKLLCSTFGTLVVAAFLAMAPPTYARGGHGGGQGETAVGMAGTAANMPRPVMLRAAKAPLGARGGRGHQFVGAARGHARQAGRAYYRTRGGGWGGYFGYPYCMDIPAIVRVITVWTTAIPTTGITDTTLEEILSLPLLDTRRP